MSKAKTVAADHVTSLPCRECGAAAGQPCFLEGYDGRTVQHTLGPVVAGPSEPEYSTNSKGKRTAWSKRETRVYTGAATRVHSSRLPKAPAKRAERLVTSEKAGEKALAQADDVECTVKRPVYALVTYRSMGGEIVGFIAGPMSAGARNALRSDCGGAPDVVPDVNVYCLSSEDVTSAADTGHCKGVRVVTLPSQYGAGGVERLADDQKPAAELPEAHRAIAARRPVPVAVDQTSWLDALAV